MPVSALDVACERSDIKRYYIQCVPSFIDACFICFVLPLKHFNHNISAASYSTNMVYT
jgi:hypothetical protein